MSDETDRPPRTLYFDLLWLGLLGLSMAVVGMYDLLFASQALDEFGNPRGAEYGLAQDQEFAGRRILIWSAEPEVHTYLYPPENPLWERLQQKGFELEFRRGHFQADWLKGADQAWIFAGRRDQLGDDGRAAIIRFLRSGKGVYLVAENEPFIEEANLLCQELFKSGVSGNYPGQKIIAVRGKGVTAEDFPRMQAASFSSSRLPGLSAPRDVIRNASHYVDDHPLLTDVAYIYEGITISHLEPSPDLLPVLTASDDKLLAAVPRDPKLKMVIDCGYTRYSCLAKSNFVSRTAGTLRFAENIAAYLSGKTAKHAPDGAAP